MLNLKNFIIITLTVCMIGAMTGCAETTATDSVSESDSSEPSETADDNDTIITADEDNSNEDLNSASNEYTDEESSSISESAEAVSETETETEPENDIYGFYSFNDTWAEMTAEVGYSTGEDADYIHINGYWYLEDCDISFEGYMNEAGENIYYAESLGEDCGLTIVFDENGMQLDVDWSEFESSEIMQGYYTKTDSADWGEIAEAAIDYLQAYGTIVNNVNAGTDYSYYHIYDIDDDGRYELITEYGDSSADYVNDVWTVDANGYAVYIGSIYGELSFYTAPDYDGIYSVYGHMGYETVSRITIQDDELFEEIVSEGEVEEDYYSNDLPISSYSTSDTSYLSEF